MDEVCSFPFANKIGRAITSSSSYLTARIIPTFLWGWLGEVWPKYFTYRLAKPNVRVRSWGRNSEFGHGTGGSSPTLLKGLRRIFKFHQLMPANGTPSLTSIRGMAQTLMNHPACEIPELQLMAESDFEPRLESLEASMRTSRPSLAAWWSTYLGLGHICSTARIQRPYAL